MSGYYSSAQYQQDKANGVGPPPASQGGPTAFEIYQHEGLVDEKGFMLSNPNVHMTTAALYGGGPQKVTNNQSLNPDYAAGGQGDTVGGIGNDDGWGNDIAWGQPVREMAQEGQIFETGAGNYRVIKNPWGQFALEPMEGATKGADAYFSNFTSGGHHIGVNPNTGEAWYQAATDRLAPDNSGASLMPLTQQQQINTLYRNLLKRNAKETGLDYWMNDLNNGMTLDQVKQNIMLSDEYLALQEQGRSQQQRGRSTQQQAQAVQQANAQRSQQEKRGMLSGDNPEWSALSNTGMQLSGGMGPFMLGQLAKRR
jgi:hypothetical protein